MWGIMLLIALRRLLTKSILLMNTGGRERVWGNRKWIRNSISTSALFLPLRLSIIAPMSPTRLDDSIYLLSADRTPGTLSMVDLIEGMLGISTAMFGILMSGILRWGIWMLGMRMFLRSDSALFMASRTWFSPFLKWLIPSLIWFSRASNWPETTTTRQLMAAIKTIDLYMVLVVCVCVAFAPKEINCFGCNQCSFLIGWISYLDCFSLGWLRIANRLYSQLERNDNITSKV